MKKLSELSRLEEEELFLRKQYMTSDYVANYCDNSELNAALRNMNAKSYLTLKQNRLADLEYSRFLNDASIVAIQGYLDSESEPFFLSVLLEGLRLMNSAFRTGQQMTEFQMKYCKFEPKRQSKGK